MQRHKTPLEEEAMEVERVEAMAAVPAVVMAEQVVVWARVVATQGVQPGAELVEVVLRVGGSAAAGWVAWAVAKAMRRPRAAQMVARKAVGAAVGAAVV